MLSIIPNKKALSYERNSSMLLRKMNKGIKFGAFKSGRAVVEEVRKILDTGTRTGVKYPRLPNRSSAVGGTSKNSEWAIS